MTFKIARVTTAALTLAFAAAAVACTRLPALRPTVTPAPTVFIYPDAVIAHAVNEKGRDIVPLLHAALDDGLTRAGYKVVTNGTANLMIQVNMAKVGYAKHGTAPQPWAEGVALAVTGGGTVLAEPRRNIVNWSDYEGATTRDRITFAAHALINQMTLDRRVADFAKNPASTAIPGSVASGAVPVVAPVVAESVPGTTHDTVFLKNGDKLRGTVVEEDPKRGVTIQLLDGTTRNVVTTDLDHVQYVHDVARTPPAAAAP